MVKRILLVIEDNEHEILKKIKKRKGKKSWEDFLVRPHLEESGAE